MSQSGNDNSQQRVDLRLNCGGGVIMGHPYFEHYVVHA